MNFVFCVWYVDSLKNLLESLRKAPDSYAELSYYAQSTMLFKANDGKVRYCRYRAIPGDMHKEKQWKSGALSNEEQKSPWYRFI